MPVTVEHCRVDRFAIGARAHARRFRPALGAMVCIVALSFIALSFTACGGTTPEASRDADVLAATIRHLVPVPDTAEEVGRTVFIGDRRGTTSLGVQADVVDELTEYDDIRFVDDRDEAIESHAPQRVRNDGVYVEIWGTNIESDTARVRALRYVDADRQRLVTLHLRRTGGQWLVERTDA